MKTCRTKKNTPGSRDGNATSDTREEAGRCVFGDIEGFYNTTRMHSSLNWQSLRKFRRAFEVTLRDATAATSAPSATIKNDIIFNRKPRPKGRGHGRVNVR